MRCTKTCVSVAALVVLAVIATAVSCQELGTELSCGVECHCTQERPNIYMGLKEWKVICNNTDDNQHAILTDTVFNEVFQGGTRISSMDHVYVRVENTTSLQVTIKFITKWRQFPSSKFDIWKGGNVELPRMNNLTLNKDATHVFAGIGIHTCILETFPGGLFEGKLTSGLRLAASTVGHLSSEVFRGTSMKYLYIDHTSIGTYEGKTGITQLSNERANKKNSVSDIYIANSKLGLINKGALAFNSKYEKWMTMENVTVGYMQVGSVVLTGKMELKMEDSRVADISYESFEISNPATIIIQNNILIAHPHALINIECSEYTKIYNNQIIPISTDSRTATDLNESGENIVEDEADTEDDDSTPSSDGPPSQFLHPSCIKPKSLKLSDPGTGSLRHALLIAIVLIVMAVIVIIFLAVLLLRAGKIKRTIPVRLGDLSEPIYDEPNVMLMNQRAPPLPKTPVPTHLGIPDFCTGTPQTAVMVDNSHSYHKNLMRTASSESRENSYVKMSMK